MGFWTSINLHHPFVKLYAFGVVSIIIKYVFIVCSINYYSTDCLLY